METSQTLIDSLTDHLALFHSSRARNPTRNSNSIQPRASILRWLSSLSVSSRRAALTILDRDLISLLFKMLSYLHRHGHCFFFVLTDDPSSPSVLYRRSRGLLARAAAGNMAETELGESILLFSSSELGNHGTDAITVSEEFVSDIDRFVEVMDVITGGRFLTGEENIGTAKTDKWPELAWLKDKGYYSLESYIVNRLEIALRISWREANGGGWGKKGRGGKGVKDKLVVATSGMTANVFWRKKGCLDWWARVDQREKQKVFDAFMGKASTTMVNEILKESENFSKKRLLFFNHQLTSSWETIKQSFFKRSRCSATSDDITLWSFERKTGSPSVINKLVVLYTISVLKKEANNYEGNSIFFTTLAMAGSISDYVMRKLREVLMLISIECTNLELLEDFGKSKSSVVVQNKGKKNNNKPKKPKSSSKSSKDNKLDGANNCSRSTEVSRQSMIVSVKEEPKGSSSTLPIQQTPQETSRSEINKDTAKAFPNGKGNLAKKKNKRKGRNKTANSCEVKNQQSNRGKKSISSVNAELLNSTLVDSSKERAGASQVFDNSHNFSNELNGTEPDRFIDNFCKFNDLVTNNNIVINKRVEQEAEQMCTSEKAEETLIPPLTPVNQTPDIPKPMLDPRNPFWEGGPHNFDMPFAPPTPHHVLTHPPLALPLSYDWPPVYRSYNRMNHNFGLSNDFVDDSEAYYLSEEEMDYNYSYSERGYNQFFGGGIMYWSPADYGSGNGNGSFCSDDSAWAWHEADVNRVIEEMTVMPSPSPSTRAGSVVGSDNGVEDSKPAVAPVKTNGNSSCGEILPYMLRPINVPSGITRRGSRSELKPGQEYHRSPCIPSSARREPSRVKRPPSPVVLCVPRVPRPPPPSPVGEFGRRRAGGLPVARSGSSSPRNWGMRGMFSEERGFMEKGQVLLDGPEVVWPKSGLTMMQPFQGTPVLQEHLMITQFSRDQQHPDIALPLQPPNSINCDSRSSMHNLLHEEIDYFCKQVDAGNVKRKPYVNWAVNRVSRCLQVLWPRSRTTLFGSNATGLALPTSDVDLVISLPPVRNLEPIKEAGILEGRNGIKETCLQHAARHLLNQEWVRNDSLKTVENTAIPVIMLEVEVPSDINLCSDNHLASDNLQEDQANMLREQGDTSLQSEVSTTKAPDNCTAAKSIRLDISFKSPSHTGLQTSELVRELIEQFPASVPLALVLKKFLADRSLDHSYSGGLSSYCLVLLITRFLQHEHHLGQPIKQNLGSLLMDFLYFFGNVFDPRQMSISIRGSGLYRNRERGLSIDPIHIDDPLYPANNVGRNCFRIHQCIKAFADAFSLLDNEIQNLPGESTTANAVLKLRLLRKIIPTIDCYE